MTVEQLINICSQYPPGTEIALRYLVPTKVEHFRDKNGRLHHVTREENHQWETSDIKSITFDPVENTLNLNTTPENYEIPA